MIDDVSIWTALADTKRRQIITLLEEKPRTTSDLSEFFDVSRFAVMKHLKVLEQARLIKVKREGRKRWNILNEDLAHFLRTRLSNEEGPNRLIDILGLFPGKTSALSAVGLPTPLLSLENAILLNAPPSEVFGALTAGIDRWWSCRAAASSRIILEPFVNGRFYEAFGQAGQGVLLGSVTYVKQNEEIRLQGTTELTDIMANNFVLNNFVQLVLDPQNNVTQLTVRHTIAGFANDTVDKALNEGWLSLLNRDLKPFVEKG